MKLSKILLGTALAACTIFSSCSTLQQDMVVTTVPQSEIKEISDYEFRLIHIDADYSFSDHLSGSDIQMKNDACDKLIKDIENILKQKDLVAAAQARLYAISGRAYLLKGANGKAKEMCALSDRTYKGDIQTLILSHRLGIVENLSEAAFISQDKPVVLIEEAIDYFKAKNYMSAVAKFDEAFINAESYYRDAYKPIRDNAWDLRGVKETSNVADYLIKKELTIGQMMLITQNHPAIIYPYTADNEFNENQLFKKLVEKGLLTATLKTEPPAKIYSYTKLTRAFEARFLWNIYCNKKNKPSLRTRYSTAYTEQKLKSPINDIKVDNEDFDAILGCVEYGFMDLPDGQNFNPNDSVSGVEFEKAVTKLK